MGTKTLILTPFFFLQSLLSGHSENRSPLQQGVVQTIRCLSYTIFSIFAKVEESIRGTPIKQFIECLIVPIFHIRNTSKILCEYCYS